MAQGLGGGGADGEQAAAVQFAGVAGFQQGLEEGGDGEARGEDDAIPLGEMLAQPGGSFDERGVFQADEGPVNQRAVP